MQKSPRLLGCYLSGAIFMFGIPLSSYVSPRGKYLGSAEKGNEVYHKVKLDKKYNLQSSL